MPLYFPILIFFNKYLLPWLIIVFMCSEYYYYNFIFSTLNAYH